MSDSSVSRPPFDPAYKGASGLPGFGDPFDVEGARRTVDATTAEGVLNAHPYLTHQDIAVPAVKSLADNSSTLAIFQTKNSTNTNRAVLLYVHGGGQVVGNRFHYLEGFLSLVYTVDDNTVLAAVEYRRAPEHPAPAAAYDCYAALVYLAEHAAELGIDPARILIHGISGGAPLAAAAVLLARKLGGPQVCAQVLSIPMIDDRDHWTSHKQFESGTLWPGKTNRQAWEMVLGADKGKPDVDEIRSPGRATDLSNLPPTFIDVGECEVFRDSAVAFATSIWKSGGSAELHVFPGIYHGAAMFEPDVPVSKAMVAAQRNFHERAFGFQTGSSAGAPRDITQASL